MSKKFIDVSFMKKTEIVQAIRNSESLDKAVTLMNGFAANGWLHLWDDAKHPDGSSVQSQWQSSQQATIERLTEQRDRLISVCIKASAFFPKDVNLDQLDTHPLNSIRLSMAEIGDAARSAIEYVADNVCTRSHPHEDMTSTCKLLAIHAKDLNDALIAEIEAEK